MLSLDVTPDSRVSLAVVLRRWSPMAAEETLICNFAP